MRLEEILEEGYSPRVSVHLDGVKPDDRGEIAGMLRGLMCSIEGWSRISGLTNELFDESPVILRFSSADNARYFKEYVEYYFSEDILESLRVKRRVYRNAAAT